MEVRNEFILEAHKIACNEWKLKIEKECPELFESKSGWYKDKKFEDKKWLFYKDFENNKSYGFDAYGNWVFNKTVLKVDFNNEYLATEEEVKEALINEAKKRGFKNGVKFYSVLFPTTDKVIGESNDKMNWQLNRNVLYMCSYNGAVFNNGKWAEIISKPIEEKINDLQKQIDQLKKQL